MTLISIHESELQNFFGQNFFGDRQLTRIPLRQSPDCHSVIRTFTPFFRFEDQVQEKYGDKDRQTGI